jgi:hypothetical protein
MTDPHLAYSPIVKKTLCSVGAHVWMSMPPVWTFAAGGMTSIDYVPAMRCDCGAYSWAEREGINER